MATKRRFTRDEMAAAIEQYGGNVRQIAAAHGCTVKTIYNTIDRYDMRGDLDYVREAAIAEAMQKLKSAPRGIRIAITRFVQSTGAIDRADLAEIFGDQK